MKQFLFLLSFCIYAFVLPISSSYAQTGINTTSVWTFKTGGPVYSSPICDNGWVYIGSDDGKMYCLDGKAGIAKWIFGTGGLIRCKPVVADTIVYFESEDGYLYALNKNSGNEVWKTDIGNTINKRVLPSLTSSPGNSWDYMQSSPCVDGGVVYVGSGDSSFYALNSQTGTVVWKVKTGNVIRSSPCTSGGIVYVGSWDRYIYAFNKTDGSIIWKYNTGGFVQESPRIYNGTLFCGARNGYFHALDAAQGTLIWRYYYGPSAPFVESSAAIENGAVYVGSSDLFKVFAFNAETGKIIWSSSVPGDTWSSPFFKTGTLYIGLAGYGHNSTAIQISGALLAMNASTGGIKWRFNTGTSTFIGGVVSSPTIDKNLIYFGSLDSLVYAVDTAYTDHAAGIGNKIEVPKIFHLNNNYPNPFNPATTIEYQVPISSHITLRIYDMMGREAATLVNGLHKPGNYKVTFDGSHLASGIYFDRLTSGTFCETKTLVLIK